MKKLTTLHILNGDASVPAFKVADLPGQAIVWREILASGPAVYSLPPEEFWQMRQSYITQTFQVPASDYQEKVLNQISELENASHFFEVVLWFDADLVCQINLLYLLYHLAQKKPAVVSVCTPKNGNIGHKTHEALQQLFEHRQMLHAEQLQQAATLWQLYAGPDPEALQTYLQENSLYSNALKQALTLHLRQFPDLQQHLGEPHKILLTALAESKATTTEIQNRFWQQDPGYGLGDWQLQTLLQELQPELIQLNDTELTLTDTGTKVLEGKATFSKKLTYWLGGAQIDQQKPAWCRDPATGKIKKC